MFNTPPCLPIYTCMETLRWIKKLGGLKKMQEINEHKAAILYNEIERNELFIGTAEKDSRSIMNVCFVMNENYKELEQEFLSFASSQGMVGLKGHRSVGGFRASIYNAMPVESVQALINTMQEFEKKHKK
jgi:phosphoserine aminotransferase